MFKNLLCLMAALMIGVSSLSVVGCSSDEVDNETSTPADAKPNSDDKPAENGDTPPDDSPPAPK